jgi:hypothetical protein
MTQTDTNSLDLTNISSIQVLDDYQAEICTGGQFVLDTINYDGGVTKGKQKFGSGTIFPQTPLPPNASAVRVRQVGGEPATYRLSFTSADGDRFTGYKRSVNNQIIPIPKGSGALRVLEVPARWEA